MADSAPVLREPAHRVSSRAPLAWTTGAVLRAVVVGAAATAVDLVGWYAAPLWAWCLFVVVALGYATVMPVYRFRVHRWETTATAVYTQRGWLSTERRIAPMSRVQTVDLDQSLLERVFGLASVTVTTASAAGPVEVEGLDRAVAEKLVDDLTRRTEAEPGDAT